MTDKQIIKVTNPNIFAVPELLALFKEGFEKASMAELWNEQVMAELQSMIAQGYHPIWVGVENGRFKALLIGLMPVSHLIPQPLVYLVFNKGTRALLKQMANECIAYLKAAGYTTWAGLNLLGEDRLHQRLFGYAGTARVRGSMLEYTVR